MRKRDRERDYRSQTILFVRFGELYESNFLFLGGGCLATAGQEADEPNQCHSIISSVVVLSFYASNIAVQQIFEKTKRTREQYMRFTTGQMEAQTATRCVAGAAQRFNCFSSKQCSMTLCECGLKETKVGLFSLLLLLLLFGSRLEPTQTK